MNIFEARTLEAFLRAISQMEKPLSQDLDQEIRRVGRGLEKHEHHVVSEILSLVKRDNDLNKHYDSAYRSLQNQYQAQERTKSLAISANGSTSLDLESQIAQILNADNIYEAVRKFISRWDSLLRIDENQSLESSQNLSSLGFLDFVDEISQQIPLEEWEKLPSDFSKNLDYYLYGTPKIEE